MAEAAGDAGCSVGITTNGDLLAAATDWILAARVDLVTVSVGGGRGHHAALRDGSHLESVLQRAGELASRAIHGRPRVQVAFLLTRTNHGELAEAVWLASRAGIREVYVTHLDCTPSTDVLAAAAFSSSGLRPGVHESLAVAQTTASRWGVRLRGPSESHEDLLVCALDPTRLAYVAVDGRVGPCAYLLLPIAGPIPRADFTGERESEPCSFGSVPEEPLGDVLSSPARRRFAAPFKARLKAEEAFRTCGLDGLGSPALAALHAADQARARALADNPFPPACAGCHKMAGW